MMISNGIILNTHKIIVYKTILDVNPKFISKKIGGF